MSSLRRSRVTPRRRASVIAWLTLASLLGVGVGAAARPALAEPSDDGPCTAKAHGPRPLHDELLRSQRGAFAKATWRRVRRLA